MIQADELIKAGKSIKAVDNIIGSSITTSLGSIVSGGMINCENIYSANDIEARTVINASDIVAVGIVTAGKDIRCHNIKAKKIIKEDKIVPTFWPNLWKRIASKV